MAASDDLTDAKIATAEARTETKIVRLENKIDNLSNLIVGKFDSLKEEVGRNDSYNRDTRLIIISTVAGSAIALGALIVAMATYGDALFGRGMIVRDLIQTTSRETLEQSKLPAALREMLGQARETLDQAKEAMGRANEALDQAKKAQSPKSP